MGRVCRRAQRALQHSKHNQKRMTVLLVETVRVVQNILFWMNCKLFHIWKEQRVNSVTKIKWRSCRRKQVKKFWKSSKAEAIPLALSSPPLPGLRQRKGTANKCKWKRLPFSHSLLWVMRKGRRGQVLPLKVLPDPPRVTQPLPAATPLQVDEELRWAFSQQTAGRKALLSANFQMLV